MLLSEKRIRGLLKEFPIFTNEELQEAETLVIRKVSPELLHMKPYRKEDRVKKFFIVETGNHRVAVPEKTPIIAFMLDTAFEENDMLYLLEEKFNNGTKRLVLHKPNPGAMAHAEEDF